MIQLQAVYELVLITRFLLNLFEGVCVLVNHMEDGHFKNYKQDMLTRSLRVALEFTF